MNRIFLIGNTTADPIKTTSGETVICRFSIAVNRRFTGSDGEKAVDFFRITTFRKMAENCAAYLSKGRKVAITGSVQISEFTDKDGNKRQGIQVVADEVEFLTLKGENKEAEGGKLERVNGDELPF